MLWIDFANSMAHDPLGQSPSQDRLDDPQWLSKFLSANGLEPMEPSDGSLPVELKALRATLHRLAASMARAGSINDADLGDLNLVLSSTPVRGSLVRTDEGFELRMSPSSSPVDNLRFAVAASCAEFIASEDLSRVRLCENPDCRWVFYDTTRSRTRRWCADSCGNLIKVRRFRERRASQGEEE